MTTQRRRRPLIEPLESRLLFSATGDIAVIDDGNSDVAYLLDAAENVDLVAIYGDHLPETVIDSSLVDVGSEILQSAEYSGFREIVFIDTSVANFEQLLDDILQNTAPDLVDIITLDPHGDGLAQINSTLLHYSNLTAIHLITHGKDGTVNLGSMTVGANNIQTYKDEFLGWQNALQEDADILIYGCNVAATKEGLQLVEQLANLTQADVAASNDLTGHKNYGGNWDLEVHQGEIESGIIVSEVMREQWVGVLANVDHIFVDTGPYELGVSTFSNIGQSFTYDSAGSTYSVNSLSFLIKKDVGAPNQTITVELRSSWNGSVLGSNTISSSLLSSSQFEWKTFSFANVNLNDNQTYVIRISSTDSSGSVKFSYHQANQYTNTSAYIQSGTPNASGWDMAFKVSGDNGVNTSPTISNAIPDQSTSENSNFNFQFASNTFSDLDGDTLTYTATLSNNNPLPSWLSFNAGTRTFSGVPDDADVGTISIKVVANDGRGGIITDQFDLAISNVNDNPYINVPVPNQNATEDSVFNYTFPANTFGDDDAGASFTYTAELAGGGTLPAWLNFNSATRTFSGTPANGDVGTLSIKLTANDGAGGTASDTFDIVIANTNDAPTVANAIPNQTATENALFNYTFPINTFNDVDVGNTLTYIAQLSGGGALPAWLSFDSATRTFSGTPSNGDVGTITIEVRASDGTATVSDFFDLVIQNVGSSNVVYETSGPSTDTQVISSGVPFFQSFYHDSPSATYTIDSIVLQLVKDPSASLQTITVTLLSGAYNGTVIGSATVSSATIGTTLAWKAFDFTDKVLTDNQLYFIKIESSSVDGLVKAAIHNTNVYPNGSYHSSGGTADITRDVAFQVSSGANIDPVIVNPIPNQNATEDSLFSFQFASNTFNDVDVGDVLTYTATMADGSALPSWLSFNAATRTFSGTPTNGDVGTISIKVRADDGQGGTPATDTFDLVVANTNDAPTVANPIPNQNATEDSVFNFTFASNTFADQDVGNTLSYSAQLAGGGALPAWLSFDAATRTFSGTPTNAHVGTLSIDVIANDGNGGTVTDTFNIVIANTNDAPTVANAIPNQNATEDSAFNFQFANNTFIDPDVGDTFTYSAQLAGGGALPFWLSFNAATRTFSGTPANGDVGSFSVDVIASDGNGGTVTDTFSITVAGTNDAPMNSVPSAQVITEDTALVFSAGNGNQLQISDVDAAGGNMDVTLSVTNGTLTLAGITGLSFTTGDGTADSTLVFSGTLANINIALATLTFNPTSNYSGAAVLSLTTSDLGNTGSGGTLTDTDTVNITINAINDAPTVANAIPNQNATEDSVFNFQFAANTFADPDVSDTLTYSVQLAGGGVLPSWLSFNAATRTFSGTPANGDVGTISLDVIADDGNGGTVTDTFNIVIANTNDAPTVANAIPNQNATEDSAFNFQFAANTFTDVDADATLTYSAQLAGGGSLPSWLTFNAATRTFSGTPTNGDVGTLSIDVIADDGNGGTVTDTFNIVIANTNDAPTVANAIPNQNATEDSAFNFQFAANTFADVDAGATLTYSAQLAGGGSLPSWLTFSAATRTFSGTPANGDVGTISIDVIADDGNGGTVTDTFNIVIANTNDAPTIANAIPNQNATEDSAFNFQFAANTFADVDAGATLTYSVQLAGGGSLPSWLTFSAATRTFSGTPANGDVGTISIDVIADDGNGGTVTDTFNIVIANTNDAPTVANAIPNRSATENIAFNFQFAANTFADPDVGDSLTYSAQLAGGGSLPAWLIFNAATRTFSGTPANGDVGTISIDVIADDGNGGTVTDTFNIVIANTNDAPTIANAIPNQNATEDSAFNFQFAANTFADVDAGATLTYSAQVAGGGSLPSWLTFSAATRTFSGTPANGDVGTISIDVIADDGNGGTVTETFNIVIANTNDAPTVANAIANQNATEDAAFNFQFATNTFADVDAGTTLTYSAQLAGGGSLPSWLTFSAATRTFSGTPANGDVGTLSIDVIADDGNGGTVTDTFNIVIANTNDAPTVANAIPNQNATEDAAFNFQFAANTFADVDAGATLTYSAQLAGGGSLPSWLTFSAATRTFSGTPANGDVGTLSIDVIADDGNGGTVTDTFNIVIANTNDAPTVANAIPNQNATEDSAFNFQFASNTFADVDAGATLTYSAQLAGGGSLPSWLTFSAATRTFSGTPANGDVGTLSIDVIADDGNGGTVTDTFNIVIANTNDAPTVANAIPNQNATEDSAFNFQFAANTFADVDAGATLTYSAQLAGGGSLPSWLTFNAATRTFSGTPTNSDVGTISIDVIADDGNGGTVTDTFNIVIANTNDAPTVANVIPNQNATEDAAFNFQFAVNTFADVDAGATLTYSAQLAGGGSLPSWLTFNAATRTFSGTPANGDVGTISIDVIADDGNGGTVTDTFNIVIANINDSPIVANAIPNQNATEDSVFNFQFAVNAFADPDAGDTLIYSVQLNGGGVLPVWLSFNPVTRTFSGTPTNADVGTLSIDVIASDGNGGTATNVFDIVITNTNDVPIIANAIPDRTAVENVAFNFQFAANSFADPDLGDSLTYTAQLAGGGALSAWLSFDPVTRTFSGTPGNVDLGVISIDVIASDGNGGSVTDTFIITVNDINDAPTVANAIPNQNATEDSAFNFQFAANTFADVDAGATLTYSAQLAGGGSLPSWLTFSAATRTFSGTPANGDVGTLSVDVIADDGNGGTVTDTFSIVIANTNDAPTIANAIPNQNATEDSAFNFQFAANTFADVDAGAALTYSAQLVGGGSLPSWLTFNAATRTFSGTPANGDVGTISIDVIADDGNGGTVTDTFNIVIANTNDAPTVANAIPNRSATENIAFNFQFAANTFVDPDVGDSLTYSVQLAGGGSLPAWLSFNTATRTFSGTPTNGDVGTISIDVIADDGNGGTVTDTFNIVVGNSNDAPTVANVIPDQNATQDAVFNFQFAANTFADIDVGDTLTYSAQLAGGGSLPSWLSFNAATRTFSGTPANGDVGTLSIDVIADDGNGGTVTNTYNIVIANTNDAPTVANVIPNQNATEDAAFNFQFAANTFADPDVSDTLTYSVQLAGGGSLPSWLSFSAATRTFSGTPANGDVGTISIDVIADDGNGGTITDTFNIVIANTNDAPTIANAIPNQNATEESAFNFQFAANTFTDPDVGDTLSYSVQLNGGGALPAWLSFNPATRTFSGTPTNADVVALSIDVIASDGNGGSVTDTFTITVNDTNDLPTVANAIPNQNATQDTAFNFQFAANTFVDIDAGATLTYSVQLNGGGSLPSWLSFNPATRTFSGTPANGDVGTISIDVIADDGNGGTVTDTFDIVITNINDAPTVANSIPNQNATEDVAFNFQFAANTFADIDAGSTLNYFAQLNGGGALPSWLSFNAATRTFSGTPVNSDVGAIFIEVIADDGNGGTISDTFTITISNVNDAPTIANAIPDQNATEDAAFNFQFAVNTFDDIDVGATLTYSAQLAGGGALPAWLSFDATTRTFSGTPANGDVGTLSINVIANDGNGGTVTDTFDIVIANANDAPAVANPIPNQSATESSAFNFQFAANAFADVDVGDTLTYTVQLAGGGALPAWLTFNAATRTFSGTPAAANIGTVSIDVIANDGNGGVISDSFDLVVNALLPNLPPVVQNGVSDQSVAEDSVFSFTLPANAFSDAESDLLSYSVQMVGGGALPSWLSFDAATRTFSGTPTNDHVGVINLQVSVSDGNGGSANDNFSITVTNTNDAPIVNTPAVNPVAQEDSSFTLSFPLTRFNDVDVGDSLDYSARLANGQPLPDWLTFDTATLTFSGIPGNADVGDIAIQLIASDGEASVSFQFVIHVEAVNDNPVASGPITINNSEDAAGDQLDLLATFSDEETSANQLQYSVVSNSNPMLVTGATIDAQTGKLIFSYGANQFGYSDLIIRARDAEGAIVETAVRINIAAVNDVPVSTGIADIRVNAGAAPQQIDLHKIFSDIEEGTTLKYSLIANTNPTVATNVQWDQTTGQMTVAFASVSGGESLITLRAQDSDGTWVETRFKVTVVAPIVIPPVVVPPEPEIPTNPPVVNPPVIPPTNPPVIDIPTVPPTTPGGGSDGGGSGGAVVLPPGVIIDPSLPTGGELPSLLGDDSQDNFNLPNDKSSRDYERIKAAINNDVSLSLLTASPSLVSLITPDAGFSPWEAADFDNEVRRMSAQMDIALDEEQNRKAIIAGITFSVTTGIVIWSLRASSLLLTLMSMLPLWRGFDPLPILDEMNKRKKKLEQQREDKRLEDRHVHEVGYLFDQANNKSTSKKI